MTEIKIQNSYRQKSLDKKYVHKRNQKCNHHAKNVLQCRILKASKTVVDSAKVQTTAKYIQFDAWVPIGIMKKKKTVKFVYLWYKFCFNKN